MRLYVEFPSDLEAKYYGLSPEGEPVEIDAVIVEPLFYAPDARPPCLYITTEDIKEKTVQKAVLTLAGSNGKVTVVDRTSPTIPRYEQQLYKDKKNKDRPPGKRGRGRPPKVKTSTPVEENMTDGQSAD